METVSRSGLLLWDQTALKSVRSGPVPVPRSGPASLLVKWAGWPSEYNSYEPASHLTNAPKLVADFEQRHK